MQLAPSRARMRTRIYAPLAGGSLIHLWLYCTSKANSFPAGNGCGKVAVRWQEWGSLHLSPNSRDPHSCQGLTPSVLLPLLASAAPCTNTLEDSSLSRPKKPFQKCDVFLTEGGEGRIKGKRINDGRKRILRFAISLFLWLWCQFISAN